MSSLSRGSKINFAAQTCIVFCRDMFHSFAWRDPLLEPLYWARHTTTSRFLATSTMGLCVLQQQPPEDIYIVSLEHARRRGHGEDDNGNDADGAEADTVTGNDVVGVFSLGRVVIAVLRYCIIRSDFILLVHLMEVGIPYQKNAEI